MTTHKSVSSGTATKSEDSSFLYRHRGTRECVKRQGGVVPQCERTQHRAEDHRGKFRQGEDQSIPEGNIITNDVKGSRCAEVSFQPSSIGEKAIKVHDVSFQSIMKCDVDICQGVERGHRVSRWHHVPRDRHVRDDGVD